MLLRSVSSKVLLSSCLALGLLAAACGPSTDWAQQCKDRAAAVNELECVAEDLLDPEEMCPESYNDTGLDYGEYFDCIFGQHSCDENGDYVFDEAECSAPTA